MTAKEFFDAYLGLWVESNKSTDPTTYNQCIDIWRAYNRKVVGAPDIFGNPPDIWANYQTDFYNKIPNTPDGFPQLGDVVIFGTKYGKYGHICIATDIADTTTFTSFDQNDPLNTPCHFQPHKYTGVLGWLRPKHLPPEASIEDKIALDLLKQIPFEGNLEGFVRQLIGEHTNYKDLESKAKQLDGFASKWVEEFKLPSGSNLVEIETEMTKLLPLEDRVNKFRLAIESAVGTFTDDTALLDGLQALRGDNLTLTTKLSECQTKLTKRKPWKSFQAGNLLVKIYKI